MSTDVTFDTGELRTHCATVSGLGTDIQAIAERADGINLGDAAYGILVGPMAGTVGRLLLEAYAEVIHSLADNFDASQQVLDRTCQVYEQVEADNAGGATGMV